MSKSKAKITWTLKIDRQLDYTVQEAVEKFGYSSKAELTREALREFLIKRKVFDLLGGEASIPKRPKHEPMNALELLTKKLSVVHPKVVKEETRKAREDVEFVLDNQVT